MLASVESLKILVENHLGLALGHHADRDELSSPARRAVLSNDVLPPATCPYFAFSEQTAFLETASSHTGLGPFSRWFYRPSLRRLHYRPPVNRAAIDCRRRRVALGFGNAEDRPLYQRP